VTLLVEWPNRPLSSVNKSYSELEVAPQSETYEEQTLRIFKRMAVQRIGYCLSLLPPDRVSNQTAKRKTICKNWTVQDYSINA